MARFLRSWLDKARNFWRRPDIVPDSGQRWLELHRDVSVTIRRVMMAQVAFCFFCLLTLGAPDEQVLDRGATFAVPFAGTTMPFVDFLVVGPLVLVGIFTYLHVFVKYKWRLELASEGKGWSEISARPPYLFNLEMPVG